ncbi:superoxide dismutase [Haloferax sp. MBLA0078]|uniref:Superoxide dismutase n=1 Tax=Haloferax marinum TaxID=2666143 RepID=A0A6A8G917_9EURY|nr:superoxide dismutase [Haloferax sp. CBA1150]MRW97377.1 superoxide dismutase [Haloferax marinum]
MLKALPIVGLAVVGSGSASAAAAYPSVIPLPTGFRPEGIVTGLGNEFFVGSLAAGAIYRGDLRTGSGEVFVPPVEGGVAVGLSHDARSNYLFVAGGPTGQASVYDANTGALVADYGLQGPPTFVNDVVVTRTAAYFTDSFRPALYRVPLGAGGDVPDQSAVEEIPLSGDFTSVGGFNANGIDAPPNGEYLIVVNSSTGLLYKVDPATGDATEIDLGGASLTAGDGILLEGRTLYVVRNQLNLIAVVQLDPEATAGEVVDEITDPQFDVPTTVAGFGNSLYAVNARFGTPDPANAEYDVVRVSK